MIISESLFRYSIEVDKSDDLEYDLGSLTAHDIHPFDETLMKCVSGFRVSLIVIVKEVSMRRYTSTSES